MRFALTVVLSLLFVSCATWKDYKRVNLNSVTPDVASMTGERRTAQAGDYFLTNWPYVNKDTVRSAKGGTVHGKNRKYFLGLIPLGGPNFDAIVPAGRAELIGRDKDGDSYFRLREPLDYKYGGWARKLVTGGFVVPADSTASARVFWQPPEYSTATYVSAVPDQSLELQPAQKTHTYVEFARKDGKTITYIGLAQNQIRFVYKEFDFNSIRPAFTQEFGFDFVPEREFGYKDSRFIVHRATSTEIEYTVLSAFGD